MFRLILTLFAAVSLALAGLSAQAASPALATIAVQAEGPDAATAQSRAMAQGEAKAFMEILQARDPGRAATIAAKVTPAQRAQLVKSVTVQQESARAGKYEASVTYVFDEAKIGQLVEEQKGMVPEVGGDALLIVPIYETGNNLLLWEPDNFWRAVMARSALENSGGKLIVPFGDGKDVLLVDSTIALAGKKEPLVELARRYGASNVAIVTAKIREKDGKQVAEVALRRPGSNETDVKLYPAQSAGESREDMLKRASADTAVRLLGLRNQYSIFAAPDSQKLKGRVVRVDFAQWRDWQAARKNFEGLPGVEFVDIGAVSSRFAQLTLYYRGDEAPIARALAARGAAPTETGKFWTVSLR